MNAGIITVAHDEEDEGFMGLFRKKVTDTGGVDELRAELVALRERLDASDQARAELDGTVSALNHRLIATAPPPPPPASEPANPVDVVDDELHQRVSTLDERIAALDDRVTAVSTELANQLSELGNDIEPMQASSERLAAEQARYQIAFRQDLAELAERLRPPRTH